MFVGYLVVSVGHEQHGVVDYVESSRAHPVFGRYRVGKLAVGYGMEFGPVYARVSYNALDGEHPVYGEVSVDLPFGSAVEGEARCPLSTSGEGWLPGHDDLLGCYAELSFRVGRGFEDSPFGVEFEVAKAFNLDSLNDDYSWNVPAGSETPALPTENLTAGISLTLRF